MPRTIAEPRIVHVEFPTPRLWRWFLNQMDNVARRTPEGFIVVDEVRWAECLSAAEGRELSSTLKLRDRKRGEISLTFSEGVVVGACGSEPQRFMGLNEADARAVAAGRRVQKQG